MFCRKCHYDLRGQTEARCPECGESYDPNDPSTFALDRRAQFHWGLCLIISGMAVAWIAPGAVHVAWLIGAIELGRLPIPYHDDPKNLGPAVAMALSAAHAMFACLFLGPFLSIAGLSAYSFTLGNNNASQRRLQTVGLLVLLSFAAWIGAFAFLCTDPFGAMKWMAD